MLQGPRRLVIGYRWQSSRGAGACDLCLSLHGQEFYKNPSAGQRPLQEMPDPPLHPNCRCKVMPIHGYAQIIAQAAAQAERRAGSRDSDKKPEKKDEQVAILSEDDTYGGFVLLGAVLGNKGRSWSDGPAYGHYGGKNWMKGRNVTGMTIEYIETQLGKVDPVDIMDDAFKKHDDSYINAEKKCDREHHSYLARNLCRHEKELQADEELVERLQQIKDNPRKIERLLRGKTDKQREYAMRFLDYAKWWFQGKVANFREDRSQEH
jgi:hypothetical protein